MSLVLAVRATEPWSVGSVIGGLVLLGLVVAAFVWVIRRNLS